jgi:hypothetical protein
VGTVRHQQWVLTDAQVAQLVRLGERIDDVWTRTNVGENLPYPITPLTETHFPVLFGLDNAPSEQPPPQLARRLYGRLYFN